MKETNNSVLKSFYCIASSHVHLHGSYPEQPYIYIIFTTVLSTKRLKDVMLEYRYKLSMTS